MISEERLLESNALKNLQKLSEERGLKFYLNPPREIVPDFLGDYRPDAIALGPEGGIIIEMKLGEVRHPRSSLQPSPVGFPVRKGGSFAQST
jgi:hypothetical protein